MADAAGWHRSERGPAPGRRAGALRGDRRHLDCVSGRDAGWLTYDFPPYDGPPHRLAKFRGQRQKWFAFRFTGDEREIVVTDWRNDQEPEFDAWRWEPLGNVAALVVPFRREVYDAVAREFARFAA